MESVGGLTVAGQDKNPCWLIVRGDVSGLSRYSVKPTTINSGLTVMKVASRVGEGKIQIFVVTTLASKKYPSAVIHGVDITGIKKGRYKVQYLNPDGSTVDLNNVDIY